MSVRIMTRVWDLALPDSDKLVLLALADCANDEGHCWPSMASLARKCSKSDRTVQHAIQRLCESGHLTRREVMGKGCNYTVHPRNDVAPEVATPRRDDAPKGTTPTPEAVSDKPSRTIISEDKSSSDLAEFVDAWNSVAVPRGAIRCRVPLSTERKRKLTPVLKRHAVDDLTEAIDAVGRSAFLTGKTPKQFRASITFLCSAEHVEKLLEGSYV